VCVCVHAHVWACLDISILISTILRSCGISGLLGLAWRHSEDAFYINFNLGRVHTSGKTWVLAFYWRKQATNKESVHS